MDNVPPCITELNDVIPFEHYADIAIGMGGVVIFQIGHNLSDIQGVAR